MSKRTANTAATTTAPAASEAQTAAKVQTHHTVHGYAVTVVGFIPVNKSDLDAQVNAAQALKAAVQSGDLSGIVGLIQVEEVRQSFVGRRVPLPAAEPTPEPEAEGEDQGEQGEGEQAQAETAEGETSGAEE